MESSKFEIFTKLHAVEEMTSRKTRSRTQLDQETDHNIYAQAKDSYKTNHVNKTLKNKTPMERKADPMKSSKK